MLHIPINTLAHYQNIPQLKLMDLGGINCQLFATKIRDYRINNSASALVTPDHEALQFYLFNHLVSVVRERFTANEELPLWASAIMWEYKDIVAKQGIRLTSYMALITTRESRHMGNKNEEWWTKNIVEPFGEKNKAFHTLIKGKGSDGVVSRFMDSPPVIEIGKFYQALEVMFNKGGFSGGYGGKPWGNITRTLHQFLNGKITQEMLIDTAYTLAHNNGPMFNKGMLYHHYTDKLKIILDIQRGGQIPEFIIDGGGSGFLNKEQRVIFNNALEHIASEFGQYVDWHKVKAAGALGDYSYNIEKQDYKHGKKPAIPVTPLPMMFGEVQAIKTGDFVIAPGISVPVLKRLQTA